MTEPTEVQTTPLPTTEEVVVTLTAILGKRTVTVQSNGRSARVVAQRVNEAFAELSKNGDSGA